MPRKMIKRGRTRPKTMTRFHRKTGIMNCVECGDNIEKSAHHDRCETCWVKNRLAGRVS